MKGADGIKNALGRLCARMKQDKRLEISVYGVLILIGVLLFLISPNDKAGNAAQSGTEAAADESGVEELENRLEGILGTIRGAGKVRVMITYDTSSRLVPAMSTDVQSGTTENTSTGGQKRERNTHGIIPPGDNIRERRYGNDSAYGNRTHRARSYSNSRRCGGRIGAGEA